MNINDELQHAQAEADRWKAVARKHEDREKVHYRALIAARSQLETALDTVAAALAKSSAIRTQRMEDR